MKNKNIIAAVLLAAFLTAIPLIVTVKAVRAQEEVQDTMGLSAKLDQILENQKAIAGQLDAIKQELNIVKIRITQQQ